MKKIATLLCCLSTIFLPSRAMEMDENNFYAEGNVENIELDPEFITRILQEGHNNFLFPANAEGYELVNLSDESFPTNAPVSTENNLVFLSTPGGAAKLRGEDKSTQTEYDATIMESVEQEIRKIQILQDHTCSKHRRESSLSVYHLICTCKKVMCTAGKGNIGRHWCLHYFDDHLAKTERTTLMKNCQVCRELREKEPRTIALHVVKDHVGMIVDNEGKSMLISEWISQNSRAAVISPLHMYCKICDKNYQHYVENKKNLSFLAAYHLEKYHASFAGNSKEKSDVISFTQPNEEEKKMKE